MTRPVGWSGEVGQRPFRVIAEERLDRKGVVYLRFWRDGNWRTTTTKSTVRLRDGEMSDRKVAGVMRQAAELHRALTAGREVEPVAAPLTIPEGFALAIDPHSGKYPKDSMHRREVKREGARAAAILRKDATWNNLKPGDLRGLYRKRAEQLRKGGHVGRRGAEVTLSRLLAVAEWLIGEGLIDAGACRMPKGWKVELGSEIEGSDPKQPRFNLEEMRAILAAAPKVDPRFALMYRVAIGLRLGQVRRCTRQHLDLEKATLRVPGRGKKGGALVVLLPEDLEVINLAREWGYLHPLEARYLLGEVPNYPLFPSGKMLGWFTDPATAVARWDQATAAPISMKQVDAWFRKAENLAGITHQKGRGTYGIKRQAVDAGKALRLSRDGLTKLGGWSDPQMADRIYADQDAIAAATEAAHARLAIRGLVTVDTVTNANTPSTPVDGEGV